MILNDGGSLSVTIFSFVGVSFGPDEDGMRSHVATELASLTLKRCVPRTRLLSMLRDLVPLME